MIIATAGHVDHGKTLLVRALTGIDTDRLPEEKRRGMTIDLGFAYRRTSGGASIGLVDVPGHERFLRNMLCGIGGIDFALVVVAADDGPMPQTREHVAILDLLAVPRGAVVVTKIDRVPAERVAQVGEQMRALLAGTRLAGAPVFPVSSTAALGIPALQRHLDAAAEACPARPARGNFRMPVDRSFTVPGAGLVVTGTARSGSIRPGDAARALVAGLPLRVRGLYAQQTAAMAGHAGERCALNIAGPGLKGEAILRGDWIVAGAVPAPTRKLDARLRILPGEARCFAHWTAVHLHLGASDVTGRIALLEGREIAPGGSGLGQLVLDRPIGGLQGDRFVIRDQAAQRTIGGGSIIDVFPPARGRTRPERLAHLRAMEIDDPAAALAALLDSAELGLDLARFAANRNLTAAEAAALFAGASMRSVPTAAGPLGFAPHHWLALTAKALDLLAAWHRRAPDTVGPAAERLFVGPGPRVAPELGAAVVAELAALGLVARQGASVRLAAHRPTANPVDVALWKKLQPVLEAGGLRPLSLREVAAAVGADGRSLAAFLVRAGRQGRVVRLADDRYLLPAALRGLAGIAEAAAVDGRITAAAFRDRSGIGRNLTIAVLEFFDRAQFTRRAGDAHDLLRPASAAFGEGTDTPYAG